MSRTMDAAPKTGSPNSGPAPVARVIQRQCACGSHASGDSGQCEACNKKKGGQIQKKLRVSAPGDAFEHEADRAADRVMATPDAEHAAVAGHDAGALVQRRTADASAQASDAASVDEPTLRSAGMPLDAETRSFFEPRFNHDFSHVRVHVDDGAASSVQAHAYTLGNRIVFGDGQYQPATRSGRHLLAHELAHVVQQSGAPSSAKSSGTLHRKGSGLLRPEEVDAVYGKWVEEMFRARGNQTMTGDLDKQVRDRLKQQVGPTNFSNWERWEQTRDAQIDAQADAQNPKKANEPFDPEAGLAAQYASMWKATEGLRSEIVRTEHLAQKINFGGGAKGAVARATAGGYTALWGVGGRTVTSAAEHAPMMVLGAAGTALGSEMAEEMLVKQGQAVKREGEEMGEDVHTAVRLVGGDMQAAYQATRPAYDKYQKAFTAFSNASISYKKNLQADGMDGFAARAKDVAAMDAAMKEMREAGNEFLMACAKLGIQHDARALDKMGDNIVKGAQGVVETAVTGALMEVAPGLGEIKNALKGTKGLGAKQLEKEAADQIAKGAAKEVDDVALASGKKTLPAAKSAESAGAKQLEKDTAQKVGDATQAAAASDGKVVAKRQGAGGHEVEVTPVGIEVCSPKPCPVIEVAYANELKVSPELAPELQQINQLRRVNPELAAEKAAQLQSKLEVVRARMTGGSQPGAAADAATARAANSRLQNPLDPPSASEASRYSVPQLDDAGRPTQVEAILKQSDMQARPRPSNPSTLPAGTEKGVGYEITHLGSHELGFPTTPGNLTTASAQTNRFLGPLATRPPTMRRVEMDVMNAVRSGQTVHYRVTAIYDGGSPYPSAFHMQASGSGADGIRIDTVIRNWTHHPK